MAATLCFPTPFYTKAPIPCAVALAKREIAYLVLIAFSLSLILLSTTTVFPWAEFDRTREIGPVEYTLQGSCDPVGFEYKLKTKPAGGGGIIGGGLGGNVNIDPGRRTYTQISGEFLDNLGMIYDSYRDKEFVYELKMQDPPAGSGIPWDPMMAPSAYLNITLHSDRIPFWWTSGENDMEVTIRFAECDLYPLLDPANDTDFSITIDSIEVMGWTETDENGNYVGDEVVLFSSVKGLSLKGLNESVTISFDSRFPGGADVMGIKARIEAHLTDFWGRPEKQTLSGSSGYINVYPVHTSTLVKGAGVPFSLIVVIISLIAGALAVALLIRGSSTHRIFVLLCALSGIVAVTWFYLGMGSAVDLLGQRLEGAAQGLTYGPGMFICLAGSIILLAVWFVGSVIEFILRRRRDDASGRFKIVDRTSASP